ncbi:MAG: F0F1 ATP synthase subunit A [Clostridia bacterium]|nr:F0F1 ATP synthase subunit A [Clostridia bacterium]
MITFKNLITQTTVTLLVSTLLLIIISLIVTRKLSKRPGGLQVVAEKLVTMLYNLVSDTMGKHNLKFAPYIGTLFLSSIVCTLLGMTNILRSATADLSVTAAWALVTTVMVWYHSIKNQGFLGWLKGFTEPVVVMTPMNIVSEIASPLSLAFRHFGNVAGGSVLTGLIYFALSAASSALFSWLPGALSEIPFLAAGIPAFLSIYFDLFSGFVQAFVFCLLTMVYIGGACPAPEEK